MFGCFLFFFVLFCFFFLGGGGGFKNITKEITRALLQLLQVLVESNKLILRAADRRVCDPSPAICTHGVEVPEGNFTPFVSLDSGA